MVDRTELSRHEAGHGRHYVVTSLFVAVFVLAGGKGFAADYDYSKDIAESWRVGFVSLRTRDLPQELGYLQFSLPLRLMDRVSEIRVRTLDEEERSLYAGELVARRRHTLHGELAVLSRKRDGLIYEQLSEQERQARLRETRELADAVAKEIAALQSYNPYAALIPEEMPLQFDTAPLEAPPFSIRAGARREEVRFLIWGELEELEGFIFWKLGCYSVLAADAIYEQEGLSEIDTLGEAVDAASAGLVEALLARPWATLLIAPSPRVSRVVVDGETRGTGTTRLSFIPPGEHHIVVDAAGYKSFETSVFLQPNEELVVDAPLVSLPTRSIEIVTEPPGARVYLDSLWLGVTPFTITAPDGMEGALRVQREGHFDRYVHLTSEVPDQLTLQLDRRLVDTVSWQKLRRRAFYRSFGIWALSIPIPIVTYAAAIDSAHARSTAVEGTADYDRYTRRAELFFYGSRVGLFVSTALFANALADLLAYVRYADDPPY